MPGLESLRQQQYYAHPRNAFWPIMAQLFGFNSELNYVERCQQLIAHQIAVWDVLKSCYRPGSLDQHIDSRTMEINDFGGFLRQNPDIQAICFNGAKAEQLFCRAVLKDLSSVPILKKLPSTSPAHAAMRFQQKLEAWQCIQAYF
ncbi:G:T/U mismatch-specific uracil/thymine DNA-glycosylase [Methylophaga frappieri]|uniref:G:T/U mismatch-specific uracil/thymine DNA-glycosylase n=2 Tax=Methylophaga frappieri (strain ATCC BAA-2434 / DSM 25690 / JAM7) TaxID=754477 RepID=I1YGN1_METFJ|nr:G:T/U mismatch-specific uracil/thymine DNA-glycosylase [Methylophaga frappieri]